MKTLAIIGSGDLGQQIAHYALTDNHYGKVVFIDDFATLGMKHGIEVLGTIEQAEGFYNNNIFDEIIIGIGYNHILKRKELYEYLSGKIPFGKIIHSSSWVDSSATIKPGCVIYPGCSIDIRAVINENVILNNGCTVAHDSSIGVHSFLSPRIALAGFVNIDEMCILGINSTVIDNIKIAAGTQLGAGTVVVKNIEKRGLYVGNPHRFIR